MKNNSDDSAMVVITVTKSQVMKIVPNIEYFGDLPHPSSTSMFLVDPPHLANIYITFSYCLGLV
jgi:hypothetical protein